MRWCSSGYAWLSVRWCSSWYMQGGCLVWEKPTMVPVALSPIWAIVSSSGPYLSRPRRRICREAAQGGRGQSAWTACSLAAISDINYRT
ncbi:hypothetical protein EDB85DRAFT_235698 [Lactarius pseudohatsudake]|nr:hypothetical protein EDB85DRAFT_235698 [Lactarius pseudohatsudake]